mgnify:FL=1
MKKNKVCWKITTRCNQNCKYCYGFKDIKELDLDDNIKVMDNLIKEGLTHITWTGGEAVLYPKFKELLQASKERGLHNKLVTNGIYLAKNDNDYVDYILDNLEEINLSIDSISNEINNELGKENNHLEIIRTVLEKTKNRDIRIGINTVVSKKNINHLQELGEFLNQYKIFKWKFLKFMPIRAKAAENKEEFEVDERDLIIKVNNLPEFENIEDIFYKEQKEFKKSMVVLPNGDVIRTDNSIDLFFGNALNENLIILGWRNIMNKIKILIAYDNEEIKNRLFNILNGITDVEVVATTNNAQDTYYKIIEHKPEMVFAKYDFGTDMNGLDIIKQSKDALKDNVPAFNFIATDISKEDFLEAKRIIGDKMNTIIREENPTRITGIIEDYKEYKKFNV